MPTKRHLLRFVTGLFFPLTSVKKKCLFFTVITPSLLEPGQSEESCQALLSSIFICYGYLAVLRSVIRKLWYRVKWCLRNVVLLMSMFAVHFCADTIERSKDRWNERQSDCIYCREKLWRSVKVLLFVKKYITSKTKQQQEKEYLLLTNFYPFCLLLVVHQRKKWVSRLLILLR